MKQNKERSLSALAALLILGIFAVGILWVLIAGAGAYSRLNTRDQQSYDRRTCVLYLTNKLRQAPNPQAVAITALGSGDALQITQTLSGQEYVTLVYCHNGWLMELFTHAREVYAPEDGEQILPLAQLSLKEENGLIAAVLTDPTGVRQPLFLSLRGKEVLP